MKIYDKKEVFLFKIFYMRAFSRVSNLLDKMCENRMLMRGGQVGNKKI